MQELCSRKTLRTCMHVEVGIFVNIKGVTIYISLATSFKFNFICLFIKMLIIYWCYFWNLVQLYGTSDSSIYVDIAVNENDVLRTLIEAIPKLLSWVNRFKYPQVHHPYLVVYYCFLSVTYFGSCWFLNPMLTFISANNFRITVSIVSVIDFYVWVLCVLLWEMQ